ncbi:MAG: hypothetical protein J5531_03835 [Lachnospiraceae bacterium]|nr:hypothetical protein [Lachnospiraceae bacterium]
MLRKRVSALMLVLIMIVMGSIGHADAFGASDVEQYGFTASSGFTYQKLKAGYKEYKYDGIVIGRIYYTVIKATSTTTFRDLDGRTRRTEAILVRVQMTPQYEVRDSTTYLGLNAYNRVQLWLEGERRYIDMAPEGTMPSSSTTYTGGVGAEVGGQDKFKFSVSTGYTSTIKDNCVTTHSSFYNDTRFDADYTYTIHSNNFIASTEAKRAMNRWATNKHNCYYAYVYTTPIDYFNTPTSMNNYGYPMTMKIQYRFRVAETSASTPSQWDGACMEVNRDSCTSVKTKIIESIK